MKKNIIALLSVLLISSVFFVSGAMSEDTPASVKETVDIGIPQGAITSETTDETPEGIDPAGDRVVTPVSKVKDGEENAPSEMAKEDHDHVLEDGTGIAH